MRCTRVRAWKAAPIPETPDEGYDESRVRRRVQEHLQQQAAYSGSTVGGARLAAFGTNPENVSCGLLVCVWPHHRHADFCIAPKSQNASSHWEISLIDMCDHHYGCLSGVRR